MAGFRIKKVIVNEDEMRRLANSEKAAAAMGRRAEVLRRETELRAQMSGYRKHLGTTVVRGLNGAVGYTYATYSFAHLDEWGGLMYATPSYPMTRAIQAMGLRFTPTPKGHK